MIVLRLIGRPDVPGCHDSAAAWSVGKSAARFCARDGGAPAAWNNHGAPATESRRG
jgi:hypothetical protein